MARLYLRIVAGLVPQQAEVTTQPYDQWSDEELYEEIVKAAISLGYLVEPKDGKTRLLGVGPDVSS